MASGSKRRVARFINGEEKPKHMEPSTAAVMPIHTSVDGLTEPSCTIMPTPSKPPNTARPVRSIPTARIATSTASETSTIFSDFVNSTCTVGDSV